MDYEIERHMPKKVIFNFDSVSFMDSAGIGLLLGRYKIVLDMCGILKLIHIYDDLDMKFNVC